VISKKDVEHIALLSRLSLTEEEKERYQKELSSILDYVNKLKEINTDDIIPTAHVIDLKNVFREDEVIPSMDRDKVLANAKEKQNGCFKVPRIIE